MDRRSGHDGPKKAGGFSLPYGKKTDDLKALENRRISETGR